MTESIAPGSGTAQNAISTMLYDVGLKIGTIWEATAGSVVTGYDMISYDVQAGFQSFGYSCDIYADGANIDYEILKDNISRGLPVMMMANGTSGGHAFVIDGIMIRKKYAYNPGWANYDVINDTPGRFDVYYIVQREKQAQQLHCLWGWTGGQGNGWYYRLTPIDTSSPVSFVGYNKAMYSIKPNN